MEKLIINQRHELPFRKKLIWDFITVLLWGGWLYLWKPVFDVIYQMLIRPDHPHEVSKTIFSDINVVPVDQALIMLVATPAILFILSRIHRHKKPSAHLILDEEDYREYFGIAKNVYHECLNSQQITVYHNEQGQIIRLENHINN